jgi:GT2 family glycosyltransferase
MTQATVGAVIIGRNEGARLVNCLTSLQAESVRVVYVDSGSTDDSLENAKQLGAECVLLDTSVPFTAARARNAGFDHIANGPNAPEFVQFLDGDCKLEPGYLAQAVAKLAGDKTLAVVTGWRAEIHPDASVYNQMCDHEWHGPVGDIRACGGDMLVRAAAFAAVGGFNPQVIAAEDDEFCTRLRKAGWRLERLPLAMTHHDANMMQFGQWWNRAVRTGHGFEQVHDLHKEYFVRERRRMWFYGAVLPALGLLGLLFFWPLAVLVLAAFTVSYLRTAQGLITAGLPKLRAMHHAFYLFLSKFPNTIGAATYHLRKRKGADMKIIEYK